jgi:oligopeptide transport system substrate-binding protein
MMKRYFARLIVSAIVGLPALLPAQSQAPDIGQELVVAFPSTELVLDPVHSFKTQELQIATALYEGLVSYHPISLKPIPAMARRWEISEDGRLYRFTLREEGRYSNGDPVTAEDFRRSWLRILNPAEQGEYSFLFDVIKGAVDYRSGRNSDPRKVGIRAPSDKVLEVELEKPASHFLSMLCHMTFMPIHPRYLQTPGWDRGTTIIGNGPFSLESRKPGEMLFVKNPHYWDVDKVRLERLRVLFMDDAEEITRKLNRDEIHWADDGVIDSLENRDLVQLYPLFGTSYLYFRSQSNPWVDPRVRRGLALLLPWESIREQFSPFDSETLVPVLYAYPDVVGMTESNVAEGLDLLKEAGYPRGKGLPPIIIKVTRGSGAETAAERLAEAWREGLSLKVEIKSYDYQTYLNELEKDDYTIGSVTWIGDFADPLAFLQIWTTGSNLNDARYSNPAYDRMIDSAMAKPWEERFAMLAEAETLLLHEAAVMPLSHPPAFNLINLDRIAGWYPNLMDIHPFKHIRFKVRKPPPDVAVR